jgi:hypothetical protein
MADHKTGSNNEEDYFHRQERERLAAKRAESATAKAAADREALKQLHYMHCPKCGATLTTETYHRVQVDRCTDCHGIWFDGGEAESLLDKEPGALAGLFGDLLGGMGKKKK